MAKKELLFSVVMLCLVFIIFAFVRISDAYASDLAPHSITAAQDGITDVIKDASESVQMIVEEGRRSAMSAMKEKWNELRVMMESAGTQELQAMDMIDASSMDNSAPTLKVFVSTSMSVPLLKSYGQMAKKYGAALVLKGLPEGSWRKLSDLICELNKNEGDSITVQIDDPAFDEYGITRVPSIVLTQQKSLFEDQNDKEAVFDKITGNIGIRRALEEFAEKGELQTDARAILNKVEGK